LATTTVFLSPLAVTASESFSCPVASMGMCTLTKGQQECRKGATRMAQGCYKGVTKSHSTCVGALSHMANTCPSLAAPHQRTTHYRAWPVCVSVCYAMITLSSHCECEDCMCECECSKSVPRVFQECS
jgi:hypothetical protein